MGLKEQKTFVHYGSDDDNSRLNDLLKKGWWIVSMAAVGGGEFGGYILVLLERTRK